MLDAFFISSVPDNVATGRYSYTLVALSYFVASFAANTAGQNDAEYEWDGVHKETKRGSSVK